MSGFAPYQPGSGLEPLQVRVRAATESDAGSLEAVQVRAGRPARGETLRHGIRDSGRYVVVAELDGENGSEVAGWAQTYHHAAAADPAPRGHYLSGVTVEPAWRRRGVATALTDARIAWVAARADEVFYVVNAGNRASIDLHIRWGFREVGRGPRFAGIEFSGGVGLLMRATL